MEIYFNISWSDDNLRGIYKSRLKVFDWLIDWLIDI